MKILLRNMLSTRAVKPALPQNTTPRLKRQGFSWVVDLLLACLLLGMNMMQPAEAAFAKYLTVVSLTFDDGHGQSAAIQPLLDSGLKATFYVNSNWIRLSGPIDNNDFLTKGELDTLFNNGHEIGGHAIDHVNLAILSDAAQRQAICDDLATLRGWYGDSVYSFAYPYASTGPTTQGIVSGGCPGNYGPQNKPIGKYESARGGGGVGCVGCPVAESMPPANPYYMATTDFVNVGTTLAELQNYVIQAEIHGGGWAPMVFHAVCNNCGTYSITAQTLTNFLTWLKARESQGTYVRTVHQVMSGNYPPPPPPPPLGPNLVINPSLETLGANNLPDCWQLGDWGSSAGTWTRTTDAYTGGFAEHLQMTAYNNGDRKIMPTMDYGQDAGECAPSVEADASYQLNAYYKSTIPSIMVLFYLDADNNWQYLLDGPHLPASTGWAKMTYDTGLLPTGAKAVSFGLAVQDVGTFTTDEYSMAKVLDSPITMPTMTTAAASGIIATGATLNGSGNPNGSAATGWFRYGTVNPGTCNDTFGARSPSAGGTSLGGGAAAAPFSQALTGLSASTTYYFCAIGNNAGGTAFGSVLSFTTSPASTGGSLSGSVTTSTAAANLTTEGTLDWLHWGDTSLNRKSGVTAQLTTYTLVGGGAATRYGNDRRPLSWTGGAPTATSTNNKNGVYIAGTGKGFSFTAPADTTPRTLTVRVGGWNSGGKLTARLSDGSAADFVNVPAAAGGQYDRNYVLSYKAGGAGNTLTVSWTMNSGAGNVTVNSAALK